MDDLYDSNASDGYDQCPVAYAVGSSSSDVLNRLTTERYDYIYADPSANNHWAAMYIMRQNPDVLDDRSVSARLTYVPEAHLAPYSPRGGVNDDDPSPSTGGDETGPDHDGDKPRYPSHQRRANVTVRYVPAVLVSVTTGETPYQTAVALAQ